MRQIKPYVFNDVDKFIEVCVDFYTGLHNQYYFYFGDICSRINDLESLIKKKKDWVKHKVSVYYIDDEVYMVIYTKDCIIVEVLVDVPNACGVAHKLTKELTKIKGRD